MFRCYSWGFKVLKLFVMSYIGSISCFMEFEGQTSMTFERCSFKWPCVSKHVSASFMCYFWMKFMWEGINYWISFFHCKRLGKHSKDQQRVLEEGSKLGDKNVRSSPQTKEASTARGPIDALLMSSMVRDLYRGKEGKSTTLFPRPRTSSTVRWSRDGLLVTFRLWNYF